jgi:hypothetical protein
LKNYKTNFLYKSGGTIHYYCIVPLFIYKIASKKNIEISPFLFKKKFIFAVLNGKEVK